MKKMLNLITAHFLKSSTLAFVIFIATHVAYGQENCESNGTVETSEFIQRVQVAEMENISDRAEGGYSETFRTIFNINVNSEPEIVINPAWTNGRIYEQGYSVWVDYNYDGDFDDNGEKVAEIPPTMDDEVSAKLKFSLGKRVGTDGSIYSRLCCIHTMRVAMKRGGIPDACEVFEYGEVEDYSISFENTCESSGGTFGEYISRFQIGDYIKTSSKEPIEFGYENFKNETIELSIGALTELSITPNWDSATPEDEGYTVAIDLNNDLEFEVDEIVAQISPTQDTEVTASFNVPDVRGRYPMRVSMARDMVPDQCTGFFGFDNGEVEDYMVRITGTTDITSFELPEQASDAIIDYTNNTIELLAEYGTDQSSLIASFNLAPGATASINSVDQVSGETSNDFTSAILYTVTAVDAVTTQDWTVTITEEDPSDQTNIRAFAFDEQTGASSVDMDNHTVEIEVDYGTDLTALIAYFTLSDNAVTSPEIGVAHDYSSPLIYTVTAEDGVTVQDWTIDVSVRAPYTDTDFLSFELAEQTTPATINLDDHTMGVEVKYGTNLSNLIGYFTLSQGASAEVNSSPQISGTTINDFTSLLTYSVTAEDMSTTQDWNITVTEKSPSLETDFLSWSIPEQTEPAIIDYVNHTIDVGVGFGVDLGGIIPEFSISEGATIQIGSVDQISGTTENDFTNPTTYTITAEDGITTQNWIVTVLQALPSTEASIISFSFDEQTGPALIVIATNQIRVEVAKDADIATLIPTIELSDGATISPLSGEVQDFSNEVTYTVTAEDGTTTQDWMVVVEIVPEPNIELGLVGFWPFSGGPEDFSGNGVDAQPLNGVQLSNDRANNPLNAYDFDGQDDYLDLPETIGPFSDITVCAWVELSSNTQRNTVFSNIFYNSEADNGGFLLDYRGDQNKQLRMLAFNDGLTEARYDFATIGNWAFVCGRYSSFQEKLTLWIDGSMVAEISSAGPKPNYNAETRHISSSFAWHGKIDDVRIYDRALSEEEIYALYELGVETDIMEFSLPQQTGPAIIDASNHTVEIEVERGTDLSSLVPVFSLSSGAFAQIGGVAQVSEINSNDFSSTVTYLVIAEDGVTTQDWTTSVSVNALVATDILSFSLPEQTGPATIDAVNHTVNIELAEGAGLTSLVPTITLSEGATISPDSEVAQDFTNPVTYTVTAEDGITIQDWVVSMSVLTSVVDLLGRGKIYPNPVSKVLMIDLDGFENQSSIISVTDLSGREIERLEVKGQIQALIDVENYPAGMYQVRIHHAEKRKTFRFVKN